MNKNPDSDKFVTRVEYLEENRRFIQNALEMALSLGDFQEKISEKSGHHEFFKETEKRIRRIIPFEARAFYSVNEDDSNLVLSVCKPDNLKPFIEKEIESMIDANLFGWIMREKRGILVDSKDHLKRFLFHIIATHSQTIGMFVSPKRGRAERGDRETY